MGREKGRNKGKGKRNLEKTEEEALKGRLTTKIKGKDGNGKGKERRRTGKEIMMGGRNLERTERKKGA